MNCALRPFWEPYPLELVWSRTQQTLDDFIDKALFVCLRLDTIALGTRQEASIEQALPREGEKDQSLGTASRIWPRLDSSLRGAGLPALFITILRSSRDGKAIDH